MQKFVWQMAAFVLVVGLLSGCGKNDKEKFQGTWIMESMELGGKKLPPAEESKDGKMVVSGDTMTFKSKKEDQESTFVLDSTKTPKTIDITPTKGKDKDLKVQGIYTFVDDNQIKLAITPKGDRPTEFTTKEDSKFMVMTLKREKAK